MSYQYNTPGRFRQEEGCFLLTEGAPGAAGDLLSRCGGERTPSAVLPHGERCGGLSKAPHTPKIEIGSMAAYAKTEGRGVKKAIPSRKLEIRFSGRFARRGRCKGSLGRKRVQFLENLRFFARDGARDSARGENVSRFGSGVARGKKDVSQTKPGFGERWRAVGAETAFIPNPPNRAFRAGESQILGEGLLFPSCPTANFGAGRDRTILSGEARR